jgi:pyruvate formate lyase activating enzyme
MSLQTNSFKRGHVLIGGLQKFSLIDYPKKVAAVIFSQGCNFLCGYCHNPELVLKKRFSKSISSEEVLSFLKTRQNKLDAIVISGGEPTLQKDLIEFIKKIKDLNFLVKLDTNGQNPIALEKLLKDNLIDYIAMDIKAPIDKYPLITNISLGLNLIQDSINLILSSKIDYEFRSTLVKEMHSFEDIESMAYLIKGSKLYILQKFVNKTTLDSKYIQYSALTDENMLKAKSICLNYVKDCSIR